MNQAAPLTSQQESSPLPWQRGWKAFKSVWPQLLYISAATIAIPQYLLYWNQSLRAAELGRSFDFDKVQSLVPLLETVKNFSLQYSLWVIALCFLATIGYFSIISVTIQALDGERPHTLRALKDGIKVFFPRRWMNIPLLFGLAVAAGLVLFLAPGLGIIGQYFAICLLVLLAALPVLLTLSPASFLESVRHALSMGYVKDSGITKWSAFFVLLTYQMALIGIVSLCKHVQTWLLDLDLNLQVSRSAWLHVGQLWPFGVLPLVLEAIVNLFLGAVLGAFAVFTCSFILDLKQKTFAPKPNYAARPDAL